MKIVLILPSLSSGGLEKVITELAWYFYQNNNTQVYLISLSKGRFFYPLPSGIQIYMPSFALVQIVRPLFLVRLMMWLRKTVKNINPDSLLSFGGKFNSFVLLSVYGLPVRTYISDRSRPSKSYGIFLDWLNSVLYKKATGIIAQTEKARTIMHARIAHPNITVIGNPLKITDTVTDNREKIILNVGRFISSKQQALLVGYFAQIRPEGWKVYFVGEGPEIKDVKRKTSELGLENEIIFQGVVENTEHFYGKSSVFAFTSVSEGFPNALGEAMAAGLACISFDCEAGPSDLIKDGINGFLIPENDDETYITKLKLLIRDESLRKEFGTRAREKAAEFSTGLIGKQYLDFLNKQSDENFN